MEYNNIIAKSLKSLLNKVDKSVLKDNEKNILKTLIVKVAEYYTKEYNRIFEHKYDWYINRKLILLSTKMVDYIVYINDTINGKYNVHYVVNDIYKEISYDNNKGYFKRKRLI